MNYAFRLAGCLIMLIVGVCLFTASFLVEPKVGVMLLRFAFSAACFSMALKPSDE